MSSRALIMWIMAGPVIVGAGAALGAIFAHIGLWSLIGLAMVVAGAGLVVALVAVCACTQPLARRLWRDPERHGRGLAWDAWVVGALLLFIMECALVLGAWTAMSKLPLSPSSGGP